MYLLTLLVGVLTVTCCSGLYLEGRLFTREDWSFLSRFCFLSDIGRMQFKFVFPYADCCNNILLYFDDGVQWPKVYKNSSKTCHQKEAVLEPENNQIINLTTRYTWSGCVLHNSSGENSGVLVCEGGRSFRSKHERWWYIAISNCKSGQLGKGIDLTYQVKLTNGHSFWTEHFSADEFGILETNLFFLIVFALMLILSIHVAVSLQNRQMLHTTYKMFMVCIALEVFGLLMLCVAIGTYASDGIGNNGLKLIGEILGTSAELLFLLLLLLLGKGFTITRGHLSYAGTIKMSVFITVYAVIDVILFLYEYILFDPGLVLYVYESPAGYGLIGLRLAAWVWFSYGIIFTLKHYPEKNKFYYPLYGIYTIWFYAIPIIVLVATFAIPRYMRRKVVNGLQRCIDFLAYSVFLTLMRPQAANRNFPYHVRTSQIGTVVSVTDGKTHATSNFPHNMYSESAGSTSAAVFDIFTVHSVVPRVAGGRENVVRNQTTRFRTSSSTESESGPPPYRAPSPPHSNVNTAGVDHMYELPAHLTVDVPDCFKATSPTNN
nr:transmembrane protein 145-like [Ciona intestinalis]|eukprot:XP_002124065.2 transmembrane protein 145-like [Ciona intestinalis]